MRNRLITITLLLVLPGIIFAAGLRKVTVSMKNRPVFELLEVLKKDGGMQIVYSKEMLTKNGVPITINIELKRQNADLVLYVASRAAGFDYEEKNGIIIILPVVIIEKTVAATALTGSLQPSLPSDSGSSNASEETKSGTVQVVEEGKPKKELSEKRYIGNFMFGQGDKVYLNLEIPIPNSSEAKRITDEMKKSLEDKTLTTNEAETLFGRGSEIRGQDITRFLNALARDTFIYLKDGSLSTTEINQLRNDFINRIVNAYEGM